MLEPLGRSFQEEPDHFERALLEKWREEDMLAKTLRLRADAEPFVFYEGPPTANGRPGIHHVIARTLKDAYCRYWTMRGRRVERKAGWDTHGLPVELEVEKKLGISGKPEIEDVGIDRFNEACRSSVFTYKEEWEQMSERIGYLLDYADPYVTYHADYVESVWFLLSRFAANGLLYRGHKVLPWCGRCGTGLSSHEVGQGYRDIDDPSVWITFPLLDATGPLEGAALVGWTTTPWTLPSNMAACVHPEFQYAVVETASGRWVLLESKVDAIFGEEDRKLIATVPGSELDGLAYEPLFAVEGMPILHEGDRVHTVVTDPFVTDEDGTGVVHLAPYGADDFRIALRDGIRVGLAVGEDGRFAAAVGAVKPGTPFKEADPELCRDLKERGRLLRKSQHRHSYPHCWRCDTPLLYLPAPAWFLRTSAYKEAMLQENARIRWSPSEIGEGRFGEWLENNVDWALSRDRYWGTPLPVWVCDAEPDHWVTIASFEDLKEHAGSLPEPFDPHRPVVDSISWPCNCEGCSGTMFRVPQVIDCWFDSGAMPFAQYHWPFENRERVAEQFPADIICEGLDQTRGWFYTLHAIATFLTRIDDALWKGDGAPPRLEPGGAYRSVVVNGMLLDAEGRKMSKRIGNIVDPWQAIAEFGVDAIRCSLLSGGAAHLSRRFDPATIREVRRRTLGTLGACYDFLSLYAGIESWSPGSTPSRFADRPVLDRWILSRAAAASEACRDAFERLDLTQALRAIDRFIVDELSNWYIRRSRRRFWGAGDPQDQTQAFETLHTALEVACRLLAPLAPFLADELGRRLSPDGSSVHLQSYPDPAAILPDADTRDPDLDRAVDVVLSAASQGRGIRERVGIRVRQPLERLLVHVADPIAGRDARQFEEALRAELNVKRVEWVDGVPEFLQVRAKPDFPRLGKRAGKRMKALAAQIGALSRETLFALQAGDSTEVEVDGEVYLLTQEDVHIETISVEGLEAATDGAVTVGLATELTDELRREGVARELVSRLQTLRKERGLEVSDRVHLQIGAGLSDALSAVLDAHLPMIAAEVLAEERVEQNMPCTELFQTIELPDGESISVALLPA